MLVNCKLGCAGKKGTTNASLDLETDEVICDFCGEELSVSTFAKRGMKYQGDVIKASPKAFQFDCLTCKKHIETEIKNDKLVGKNCKKDCAFNVSKFTIHGMKELSSRKSIEEEEKHSDE